MTSSRPRTALPGIEAARRELPDLILCDVNMEKVNGYLTLSALRNEPATAAIPFILMTGLADNAGMRQGMELGADDYLPKPFAIEALYAAVDARLKKAQALRQEAEKKLADLRDSISMMLPHELRTPLNGIVAYGEILAADAASLPHAEIAEMGRVIYDSGKRLERLVENFLIYAQIELLAADPQKVSALRHKKTPSPRSLIEQHARAQAQAAERANDLVLELADQPMPISEDYLAKIVEELVQNAFKFSDAGRRVHLALFALPNGVALSVIGPGAGLLDRTHHPGRRLYAVRPEDARAAGARPRANHCQALNRAAWRHADHPEQAGLCYHGDREASRTGFRIALERRPVQRRYATGSCLHVAQISNLLYRRLAVGMVEPWHDLRVGNPRYLHRRAATAPG